MRTRQLIVLLATLALAITGCGGDDDPAAPGGGGGGGGNAAMSATIDGAAWTGVIVQAVNNGGIVGIGGSDAGGTTAVGVGFAGTTTGTYTIGTGSTGTGNVTGSPSGGWAASASSGSGLINVTTLTATRVAGNFEFTAAAYGGATPAARVVTAGSFDVGFSTP